jgi:hypothetical protein
MSAFVVLTLTFSNPISSVADSIDALKGSGWYLPHDGRITFLVDRTNDYTWQHASADAESETLMQLEHELASGAKVGVRLYSSKDEDHEVFVTFIKPLSIAAFISADRRIIDIGNGQELTDMSWYIQYLMRPLCAGLIKNQLQSLEWSERP